MSTRRLWTKHAFFSLLEHGAIRVLDAATTFVLIRVLSANDLGQFSIYQSWVAILLLFLPAIELALFRDYGHLKRDGTLSSELGYYRRFNFLKLALVVFMVSFFSIPGESTYLSRWSLLALAFALPFSQAFYSYLREPLRFEMRQDRVAAIGALQRIAVLGCVASAAWLFPQQVSVLALSATACFVLFGYIWSKASVVPVSEPPEGTFWFRISNVFFSSVLWIHLNGVLFQATQTLDVAALSWRQAPMDLIGHYGISLKVAGFFQVIPIAIVSSFGIFLGKHAGELDRKKELSLVWRHSLMFLVVCGALFALGLWVGPPVIEFLGKGKIDSKTIETTLAYYRWHLGGVLLLCVTHPLTTYLNARAPLRKLCLTVYVPWALLSGALYLWSASVSSSLGTPDSLLATARMNVAVYIIFALLLGLHTLAFAQKRDN